VEVAVSVGQDLVGTEGTFKTLTKIKVDVFQQFRYQLRELAIGPWAL